MATQALPLTALKSQPAVEVATPIRTRTAATPFWLASLQGLASLRLTVVLLSLTVILVFLGTLAQWRKETFVAVGQYFRTPIAWVQLGDLVPESFFAKTQLFGQEFNLTKQVEDWEKATRDSWRDLVPLEWWRNTFADGFAFPFPGGMTLGVLMALNLLAAHGLKFRTQARGWKLGAGLGLIALGTVFSLMVIVTHVDSYIDDAGGQPYRVLWLGIKIGLAALWAMAGYLVVALDKRQFIEKCLIGGAGVLTFALFCWLVAIGDPPVNDNSSRILWQLIKATIAGGILLSGCWFLFSKRAGVVLLHSGLMLLLVNELIVYAFHTEWKMDIAEGGYNYVAYNLNKTELTLTHVDPQNPEKFEVIRVPASRLQAAYNNKSRIQDPNLPLEIEVEEFFVNATVDMRQPGDAASGLQFINGRETLYVKPQQVPAVTGTGGGEVNTPAVKVRLFAPGATTPLGTYWQALRASQYYATPYENLGRGESSPFTPRRVELDGKPYDLNLQFARDYKPYALYVSEVRGDNYLGSKTARNYSSDIEMFDPVGQPIRAKHIKMNDPLRHAGETFYQSGYTRDPIYGAEFTSLQIVENTSWMIPYLACMIVGTGLMFHFLVTLLRYLHRQEAPVAAVRPRAWFSPLTFWSGVAGGALALAVMGLSLVISRQPAVDTAQEMNLREFGKLPAVFMGRMKPFDSLARNALTIISRRENFKDTNDKTQPAIRWLLDLYTGSHDFADQRFIYIENDQILDELKLERREKHFYSLAEVFKNLANLDKYTHSAQGKDLRDYTTTERKAMELNVRLGVVNALKSGVIPPREIDLAQLRQAIPPKMVGDVGLLMHFNNLQDISLQKPQFIPYEIPAEFGAENLKKISEQQKLTASALNVLLKTDGYLPTTDLFEQELLPLAVVQELEEMRKVLRPAGGENPFAKKFQSILAAYAANQPAAFNQAVADYRQMLAGHRFNSANYDPAALETEAWYNHWNPFSTAMILYLIGGVLALAGFLFADTTWGKGLQSGVFWFLLGVLTMHLIGLSIRVYLSGRPPVTNLYSSAIFIGCGCVILALALEWFSRTHLGNFVAALMGFFTILISTGLYGDIADWSKTGGDTMGVMQAVLDTNFWLATHVTTVALGYAATGLAGAFGAVFVLAGICTPLLKESQEKKLSQMIYGTLCFAILFSFIGTVLGGLWADDSWGRFWGWDPKENGAFIIVLWNAIVLHARWGGMVQDRGVALLSIFGGVVTAWSYFGTNELGVGLHSYGFTEGVLLKMLIFDAALMGIILLGTLPRSLWWSVRSRVASA
ncbi:MAG: cytochrome c biogenesis protein CcsA [Pirellulales bacterium]|nr:cytochrome c biogenesis protein CcsA [Pirellulales bacterium]